MEQELSTIEDALRNSGRRYVAVGEIGFDLYWDKTTLAIQHGAFERQVAWAKELGLPIVIHVREAFEALFEAMDRLNDDRLSGVVHCFTGDLEQAERVLAYGDFYVLLLGIVILFQSMLFFRFLEQENPMVFFVLEFFYRCSF